MEWRCEWCGKPHESDDPPCDNCGHGSFERAVVPATDLADGEQEAAIVWICTDCGREHPKHNPPCSRCGNPELEQSRLTLDEEELSSPGYLDLVTPRYVVAAVLTVAFALIVVLGMLGVVSVPGLSGGDVPGDPDRIDGASLADAEDTYLETFNDRLSEAGYDRLERSEDLDAAATTVNREVVRAEYENDRIDQQRVANAIDSACAEMRVPETFVVPADQIDGDPGRAMIEYRLDAEYDIPEPEGDAVGVDAHAGPDGDLFVAVVVC